MVQHLNSKQFEDYCRQELDGAELLAVSDHLSACEACRRGLEAALNGDAAFFALRSAIFAEAAEPAAPQLERAHLTEDQMGRYLDENLSGEERQTVIDHLTVCAQCALAVDDLRAFKTMIEPSLAREYQPTPVPVQPAGGWWQRMREALPDLFRLPPKPALGAALALLLLSVTGWLIWRATRANAPPQEIAVVVPPSPSPLVSPTPPTAPTPSPAALAAPVVAQLNDGGGQLKLDGEGRLSGAEELPPVYRNRLKEALATRRIARSAQLQGLTRPPSALMSGDKEQRDFSVIEPAGAVLLTDRPTFRWSPLTGANAYVVEVYDEKFNPVSTSPPLAARSWTAPRALARGKLYTWQVKASREGQEEQITAPRPPAPPARFRVLDGAKAQELARARRAYASSHLTMGLLYAEAGLLQEAEQELRALRKANPGSELARTLLDQVRALRRRH